MMSESPHAMALKKPGSAADGGKLLQLTGLAEVLSN